MLNLRMMIIAQLIESPLQPIVASVNLSYNAHMIKFKLNGKDKEVAEAPEKPLLWVLRESLGMCGTKFGCGMGLCGACTVHLDGEPVRSCLTPISAASGKAVTTIEGIANGDQLHPIQAAWVRLGVPQCGYCQSGQIMSACALVAKNKNPSDADIDAAMAGNICRCGTYDRIRTAIKESARDIK